MGTPPPLPLLKHPSNPDLDIVIYPDQSSWLIRLWHSFLNRWWLWSFSVRPGPHIEDMARQLATGKRDSHVPLGAFTGGYTALEWIDATRAIHGYEPLLRLPVQRGGNIEPPKDAQIAIYQIGTADPVGWFDSKRNWIEAPPQAQHEEMLHAAADWRAE